MNFPICLILLFGLTYIQNIEGVIDYDLKLKGYETEGTDYFDLSGLKMVKISKKKYGFNGTMIVKEDITDDLRVSCACCKKTGNHYVETFSIRIKDMVFCKMYEDDQFISQDYKRSINVPMKCPIKKGTYDIINYSPDSKKLPPTIPEGEWRVLNDFTITKEDKREMVAQTTMYFNIEKSVD